MSFSFSNHKFGALLYVAENLQSLALYSADFTSELFRLIANTFPAVATFILRELNSAMASATVPQDEILHPK